MQLRGTLKKNFVRTFPASVGVIPESVIRGQRNPRHLGLPTRLRKARRGQGLSLRALAERAGLFAGMVRALEGGRVPQVDTIEKVASALGLSPCWLAYGIEVESGPLAADGLKSGELGARLKRARAARGQSRNALGKEAHLSHTAVGNIEDKGAMPSVSTVERLACALGIDPCWLGYGHGAAPDLPPTTSTPAAEPEGG